MPRDKAWAEETFHAWLVASDLMLGHPRKVEVVYQKVIDIGTEKLRVFLVHYRTDKAEFVGFVGPVCHSFVGFRMEHVDQIRRQDRYQRLLNLYMGWYLCQTVSQHPSYGQWRAEILSREQLQETFNKAPPRGFSVSVSDGEEFVSNYEALEYSYTTIPLKHCQIEIAPSEQLAEAVWLDGRAHYVTPVVAHIDLSCGKDPRHKTVGVRKVLRIQSQKKGSTIRLIDRTFQFYDPWWKDRNTLFEQLPLFHYIGTLYGPIDFEAKRERELNRFVEQLKNRVRG